MDKDIRVANPVLIKIVDENYIFEYSEKNSEEEQIQLRNFGLRYIIILKFSLVALPVIEAHCRYRKSARYEDLLAIEVEVTELRAASLRMAWVSAS